LRPPGPPRLHVWVGLVVATVGLVVATYAYTGNRAYEIIYVPVAVLGFLLVLVGSLEAGWGQANKPRMGGRKAARRAAAKRKD